MITPNAIVLDTKLTEDGIVCSHPVLGKIATIYPTGKFPDAPTPSTGQWYVFPYSFAPVERAARFDNLRAAEYYALALAHEHYERVSK